MREGVGCRERFPGRERVRLMFVGERIQANNLLKLFFFSFGSEAIQGPGRINITLALMKPRQEKKVVKRSRDAGPGS